MNGFTRTPRSIRAHSLLWLGLFVIGVGSWSANQAEAAAIHHANKTEKVDPAKFRTWSEYLMGGPTVWTSVAHPQLTAAIEASMWKAIRSDPPPDPNAVVQFFMFRQSLAPARFDHFHPRIAVALSKIEAQLITPATTTATTATPSTTTTSTPSSPTDQAQQLTPAAVPEPATLFLTMGMAGYALWWRRRRT
jgi:PEP-CTERM motif